MEFSAKYLAELLGGTVEGNEEAVVSKLSKIEEGEPNSLSFLANPAYTEYIYETKATVIIVDEKLKLERPVLDTCTLVRVSDPRMCFAKLLEAYHNMKSQAKTGISKSACIDDSVKLGENVYVGPNSVIGAGVTIGNNSKIYPNATIGDQVTIGENTTIYGGAQVYDECNIGNNVIIQSGAIIGGDGFGFAPSSTNDYQKVIHTGNVVIEDYCEIGANTTIDKATLGSTVIRRGVKLDNLIQIAHNVEIGENTVIAAQTGVAGSTKIGKNCMIGGQVGIVGHITIADEVKIAAQSGIGNSISNKGEIVQGSPAFGIGDYKRSYVVYRSLPDLKNKVSELEKQVNNMKQSSN